MSSQAIVPAIYVTNLYDTSAAGNAKITFGGGSKSITFNTNNTDQMIINSSGNVGIGTTSPTGLLEVAKNQNASTYLKITNTDTTDGNSRARIALTGGTVVQEMQSLAGDGGYIGTTSNHPLKIYTNGGNRLTIDTDGNVGIGTTSPALQTHVVTAVNGGGLQVENSVLSNNILMRLQRGGDASTRWDVTNMGSDGSFRVNYGNSLTNMLTVSTTGNVGIGTTSPMARLEINAKANGSGYGLFVDTTTRTTGENYVYFGDAGTPDFTVTTSGNVGIGMTTPYATAKLGVNGNMELRGILYTVGGDIQGMAALPGSAGPLLLNKLGGSVGIGDASPDALLDVKGTVCLDLNADESCTDNTSAISDSRLKTNVSTITDSLSLVNQLRPVRFNWNGTHNVGTSSSLGFLAQEVEVIFPELVITDTAGYKNLDYSKLTAVLSGAVQTLDTRTRWMQNAATSTVLTVDVAGRIGIGTTTPTHTLSVAGDIAAIAFVNTSTKTAKKDISYLTASSSGDRLSQLTNLKVATYRYTVEDEQNPLRLGLIAEDTATIAPEILSADGLGVDLYQFATFTLAGVQALAARVAEHETRLTSLEERLAALESGAISSASGTLSLSSSTEQLANWFADASNGIGELIAKTFRASEKICVDDQCLTRDDVKALLALTASSTPATPVTAVAPSELTLTLIGSSPVYVSVGGTYVEEGVVISGGDADASYTVYVDGVVSDTLTPALDTSVPTTHILTYYAMDGAEDSATVNRSVIVGSTDSASTTVSSTTDATATTSPITITDVTTATTTTTTTDTSTATTSPITIVDVTTSTTTATSTAAI